MSGTCFMDNRENWTGRHQTLAVMPNHYPISALSLLLFPIEHRAFLKPEDLASAIGFRRRFSDYLVFHNMKGSGASRPDHVHLQGVLRNEPFAIECVRRVPVFSVSGTT